MVAMMTIIALKNILLLWTIHEYLGILQASYDSESTRQQQVDSINVGVRTKVSFKIGNKYYSFELLFPLSMMKKNKIGFKSTF